MSAHEDGFTGEARWVAEDVARISSLTLPSPYAPHWPMRIPGQLLSKPPAQPVPHSSAGVGRRQLYSKEQWIAQKQVIYRLYNLENKPYKRVVEILGTEHNFFPTRRQFYRKISEWGFEKNIKESKMRALAQNAGNDGTSAVVELENRQINPEKIQRWQKRQGRMKGTLRSITNLQVDDKSLHETDEHETPLPPAGNSTFTPVDSASALPKEVIETSQGLDIWATVDVPGSPLLSRLFEALQLECPTEIPPISIGSPISYSAQSYLADTVTGDIFNVERTDDAVENDAAKEDATSASSLRSCSSVVLWSEDPPLSHTGLNLPKVSFEEWAFSQWDFSKGRPFTMERNMGPMRPISPFPTSPTTISGGTRACRLPLPPDYWKVLETREVTYRNRLSSLKQSPSKDDSRTLQTMNNLAWVYKEQGKTQQAECLMLDIALSLEKIHGFEHCTTLEAYQRLAKTMYVRGKVQQAAKIHQNVHAKILSLLDPDDDLALESTITLSCIYRTLNQYEEANRLNRQILQTRLTTLGPRHRESLRAMRRVATSLKNYGKLLDSEQLLGIVVQLQQETEGLNDMSICYNEKELAMVLMYQGRFIECKSLALKLAQRLEISYGSDHQMTLRCFSIAGQCLSRLGQDAESESLLQVTLERQLKRLGETNLDTTNTMLYLAGLLKKGGRNQEAISRYEMCFRSYVENFGLEHAKTIDICDKLGRCYETLGRYEAAFGLYERTVHQLRTSSADDHPAIVRVCRWIAELRDIVDAIPEHVRREQIMET